MMKLVLVFNVPSHYREDIYGEIEKEFDCSWFFERVDSSVMRFDTSKYRRVAELSVFQVGPFYWVKGLLRLLRLDSSRYLMIGATRDLSLFFFLLLKKIFFSTKKVYLWTHGYYGRESWIEKVIYKRPLMKMADGLFLYGNYARRLMINDGFKQEGLFVIHNSLSYREQLEIRKTLVPSDIYVRHFKNDNQVLIFIGRLTSVKRLDMILDAMSSLQERGENYNLVFVGDGGERSNLERKADELGLTERIWFYGECYDEKTNAELLYNADMCVAPGNVGLTAIHSMMFGCPVITHDDFKNQMPEFEAIKAGMNGAFFRREDVYSLSDTISEWIRSSIKRRDSIRELCYKEIDASWTPEFQINVIKRVFNGEL